MRESVQQIRVSNQIKEDSRSKPYLKPYGRYKGRFGDKEKNPQRPKVDRFKGPPRGKFTRNFKEKEDKTRDEDKKDG